MCAKQSISRGTRISCPWLFLIEFLKLSDYHCCSYVWWWSNNWSRFSNNNRVNTTQNYSSSIYCIIRLGFFVFRSYIANRVTDKLTKVCDNIYCCRSGSAADTQAITDIVAYYMDLSRYNLWMIIVPVTLSINNCVYSLAFKWVNHH